MHTILTIYTKDFDSNENIVNGGMSGKIFLDMDNRIGMEFKTMDLALEYCTTNNMEIDEIDFNYVQNDGVQMFKKFKILVNT